MSLPEHAAGPSRLPDRFEDEELVVRQWRVEDAPLLHEAITASIEHLRPWMAWIELEPQTIDQREALITGWRDAWGDGGDVPVGVFLDDLVVGGAGLHRRLGPGALEIGYWIRADHAGRGLATRVSRLLTSGAFTLPDVTHVEIHCDRANIASGRVPEKLGFTYIGDIEKPPLAPAETGTQRVYRVTRDDWLSR